MSFDDQSDPGSSNVGISFDIKDDDIGKTKKSIQAILDLQTQPTENKDTNTEE